MKTREEQIAEMARAIDRNTTLALNTLGSHNNGRGMWYAEKLYAAGYRKQSDTVREFVEKLKKALFAKCTYILAVSDPNEYDMKSRDVIASIDELAKEYGAEVEELPTTFAF